MLHTLVAGLGRSGAGLHLQVLRKARAAAGELFGELLGCDPDPAARAGHAGLTAVASARAAAELADPDRTVVHVCTPPRGRAALLAELTGLGYRRFVVEKPVAADPAEYARIDALRTAHRLELEVVAHWLDSELTRRLAAAVAAGTRGPLRAIEFDQHKPRFRREGPAGHPTAFDVELPHSLGVVLHLAGAAELAEAECADLRRGAEVVPRMGAARMLLRHSGGAVSELRSDLTAPVRQRRVHLEFARGRLTGHYPLGEQDEHAQLIAEDGEPEVFADDALTAFALRAYRRFAGQAAGPDTFGLHREVVALTAAAKRTCRTAARPPRWAHSPQPQRSA